MPKSPPALKISKCSKIYADNTIAVNDVSFTIEQGEIAVLLGLNGAGKTSLISMITGLNTISSGDIEISGYNITKNPFLAKQKLGIMPQEINFNPFLSVMETLIYHGGYFAIKENEVRKNTEQLLKKARLWKKKDLPVGSLSGGMKRILMLIRSLVQNPSMLILDEPTANLDIEIRQIIWDILKDLHKNNIAILLTTHNLEEAQKLCEKVIIIHKGELIYNKSIHNTVSSLQERFFTLSFNKKITDYSIFEQLQYQIINPLSIIICLKKDDQLGDILAKINSCGMQINNIAPSKNQLEQLLHQSTV